MVQETGKVCGPHEDIFVIVKVVDIDTGKLCGPNEDGEIWMKGPGNMKGYHNKPQATADTLDNEGYIHSG